MASTTLQPVADRLKTIIDGLNLTPVVTCYRWTPGMAGMNSIPAAVIELPKFQRTALDARESQLGTKDWYLTYPVVWYFDLAEAVNAQLAAAQYVEAFVNGVDADQTLGGLAIDAKVVNGDVSYITDQARALLTYECEVQVLRFE